MEHCKVGHDDVVAGLRFLLCLGLLGACLPHNVGVSQMTIHPYFGHLHMGEVLDLSTICTHLEVQSSVCLSRPVRVR